MLLFLLEFVLFSWSSLGLTFLVLIFNSPTLKTFLRLGFQSRTRRGSSFGINNDNHLLRLVEKYFGFSSREAFL